MHTSQKSSSLSACRSTCAALGLAAAALLIGSPLAATAEPLSITMNKVSAAGVGDVMGTIVIEEIDNAKTALGGAAEHGVSIKVDLKGLMPGSHGFHLHQNGSCNPAPKDGKPSAAEAAGGHFDPSETHAHKGPQGGGHKGDLPVLIASADGTVKVTQLVPDLSLKDLKGKALMVHEGGDNYSDMPKPLGGGGTRIACGLIK